MGEIALILIPIYWVAITLVYFLGLKKRIEDARNDFNNIAQTRDSLAWGSSKTMGKTKYYRIKLAQSKGNNNAT